MQRAAHPSSSTFTPSKKKRANAQADTADAATQPLADASNTAAEAAALSTNYVFGIPSHTTRWSEMQEQATEEELKECEERAAANGRQLAPATTANRAGRNNSSSSGGNLTRTVSTPTPTSSLSAIGFRTPTTTPQHAATTPNRNSSKPSKASNAAASAAASAKRKLSYSSSASGRDAAQQ